MVNRILMPIACPNGFNPDNGKRRVSVYFAPRILANTTLNQLQDWSNWPAAIASFDIEFTTNLGAVAPANVTQISTPNGTQWTKVFAADTPVTGYVANDYRNTPFTFFPEGAIAADIVQLYRRVAVDNPLNPPSAAELLDMPATSDVLSSGQLSADLATARAYARRLGNLPSSTPPAPTWDFHQALSLLGRHPALMRMLGMVVDYELPSGGNVTWIAASSTWEAAFAGTGTLREVSPRVQCNNTTFRMRTNPGLNAARTGSASGFLSLGLGDYQLISLDVTTAVQRLGALARELAGPKATGALPALTDSGLSLTRTDRAAELNRQFLDDYQTDQAIADYLSGAEDNPPDLYLENLRVGYRVDVGRPLVAAGDDPPRSLFARQSNGYILGAAPPTTVTPAADEGWVGSTHSTDRVQGGGGLANTNRLSATLARWRGWGLAIQPPGTVVDPQTQTAGTTPPNAIDSGAKVRFTTTYRAVAGSLPRLQYGQTYVMLARAVDITGNSVPLLTDLDDAPANAASPATVYGRFDPLPAPVVIRRSAKPVPGVADRVDRIVIKSNYNTAPAAIPSNDRMVFPPATSAATCERHGFPNDGTSGDPKPGLSGSSTDYALLAARDGLDAADQGVIDPATGEVVAGTLNGQTVNPGATTQVAAYLPEPAGQTLSMRNVPGTSAQLLAAFTGTWPSLTARRLVVEAAPSQAQPAPVVDGSATVTIKLPKAAQAVIELSVAPSGLANHFALFHEIAAADPGNVATIKQHVENGRHWMVSSRRKVKVVHAVRQPLAIPSVASMTGDRPDVGSHTFSLSGVANLNRASTGRTILTGTWTDPIDDVTEPGPGERTGTLVVGTQTVDLSGTATSADVALENRFPDARRHQLMIKQEAYTRFARDFTEQAEVTFDSDTKTLNALGVLAASVKLSAGATTIYVEGTDYALDPAAGTVTRLPGGAIAGGATVTALYVALPLSRFSDEAGAADFEVTVPNAKNPAPLPVHSVIPSFKRTTSKKKTKITVLTDPRVVRVYLERPWFDTGVGELLGVVLDKTAGPLPAVPPHTRYARDSILAVGDVPRPALGHFTGSTPGIADGLRVAGYPVTYDAGRKLWYADVFVNAALGYRAFVQLGLARYQPEAIDGAGLSRVNQQDPVLLGAPRLVTLKKKKSKVEVSVKGVDHEGRKVGASRNLFNTVTISVQAADKTIADAELRWTERPLGNREINCARTAGAQATTWKGNVDLVTLLKKLAKKKLKNVRLVITESEPMSGTNDAGTAEILEYRPVFTEVVTLPKSWLKVTKA